MTPVFEGADTLGEGPVWDCRAGLLYWLDIKRRLLQCYDPSTNEVRRWDLPEQPGCCAVRESGRLLLALESGFVTLDLDSGRIEPLLDPEPEWPGNRFNDGACDRRGRMWAGTMDDAEVGARTGSLYRYEADGSCERVLDGLGIPNTFAWSPDDATMYFADSMDRTIWAFEFDAESGTLGERRVFAETPEGIYPDGSALDAEGYLWNAQFDGSRVVRYAPDGSVDRIVEVPVQRPTSCAFGGPDLDVLYLTSARMGLTVQRLAKQPLAGALLALDVGVAGLPEPRFAG